MTDIFHQRFGKSDNKLVILHGLFGSGDNWRSIAQKYLVQDFEVYLVDQRNHGRSFHHDEHNYVTLAQDVIDLLDSLELNRITLLGHSMGGKTAMRLAQMAEDRLAKLISRYRHRVHAHSYAKIIEAMKALPVESATSRKELEAFMTERLSDPVLTGFLLKSVERLENGHYRWRINLPAIEAGRHDIIGWQDIETALKLPTLFVAGGASSYIRIDDEPRIHAQFENAEIVEIPKAGHWLHYQAPKALYR